MKLMRKLKGMWLIISLLVAILHLYNLTKELNKDVDELTKVVVAKNNEIISLTENFARIEENMETLVTSNTGGSILNNNNSTDWSNLIESNQWKPLDLPKINPLAYPQRSRSTIDILLGINRFRLDSNFANPLNNSIESGGGISIPEGSLK